MTYRGYVKVTFAELSHLPEGTQVRIEVEDRSTSFSPPPRAKLQPFEPVSMAGESLADEIIRDRR